MKEDALIELIQNKIPKPKKHGILGIGDDCAVIPGRGSNSWVITTDLLTEGVHFDLKTTNAFDLGYKSLAVNISDVASMGATPRYSFLSIALPLKTPGSWIKRWTDGFREISKKYNVCVLGGDTNRSQSGIAINFCVIGEASTAQIKLRSGARPGNLICISRPVGKAALALKLKVRGSRTEMGKALHRPEPEVKMGKLLGKSKAVTAMMDLSDGLARDLPRLLKASKVSGQIELDSLPVTSTLVRECKRLRIPPLEIAASGGDDYALLFTVKNPQFVSLRRRILRTLKREIFCIGSISEGKGKLTWTQNGKHCKLSLNSFEHF